MTSNTRIDQLIAGLLAVVSAGATGCYRTAIRSPQAMAAGPEYQDRQWFTMAGLVNLSDPAGQQCPAGVASATSRLAGADMVIEALLAVGGGALGVSVCKLPGNPTTAQSAAHATCLTAFSAAIPFLLGSRTVTYSCSQPRASMGLQHPIDLALETDRERRQAQAAREEAARSKE